MTNNDVRCLNGHNVPAGQPFCGQCGAAATLEKPVAGTHDPVATPAAPVTGTHGATASGGPRRSRLPLIAAALAVLLLAGGAVVAFALIGGDSNNEDAKAAGPDTFDVRGSVQLIASGLYQDSSTCAGGGGYDDLQAGAQVLIRDAAGKILATGALEPGEPASGGLNVTCDFQFEVPDVPSTGTNYTVEVTHRGQVAFTEAQADNIALSLS